jgi:2-polyprenyl-6-hydroxyphenyl methylase/3-demethylubiquinone-9 3-methyltransferase
MITPKLACIDPPRAGLPHRSESPPKGTDTELSLASPEFVWNQPGATLVHALILPTLLRWLKKTGARTVLDLGCGNGALTSVLAETGFDPVGADMSASGLALARQSYPNIPFHHMDVAQPLTRELQGSFDAVVAVEVVEHLLLPRQLFQRAREALHPEGTVIVTTPFHGFLKNLALSLTNQWDQHWHPLRDYGHVKFFSRQTLTELFLEQGFKVSQFHRVGRIPALAKSMIAQGHQRSLS